MCTLVSLTRNAVTSSRHVLGPVPVLNGWWTRHVHSEAMIVAVCLTSSLCHASQSPFQRQHNHPHPLPSGRSQGGERAVPVEAGKPACGWGVRSLLGLGQHPGYQCCPPTSHPGRQPRPGGHGQLALLSWSNGQGLNAFIPSCFRDPRLAEPVISR